MIEQSAMTETAELLGSNLLILYFGNCFELRISKFGFR